MNDLILTDDNSKSWKLKVTDQLALHILLIEEDGLFTFTLDGADGQIDIVEGDLQTCFRTIERGVAGLQQALTTFQQTYSPVIIKDGLVDYWCEDSQGTDIQDVVEVPWATRQCGNAATLEFMAGHTRQLEADGYLNIGFTQTW